MGAARLPLTEAELRLVADERRAVRIKVNYVAGRTLLQCLDLPHSGGELAKRFTKPLRASGGTKDRSHGRLSAELEAHSTARSTWRGELVNL